MEIIQSQINVTLTKSQLLELIQEALTTEAGTAIKRAIAPLLAESFPQFPEFTAIKFSDTQNEDGSVEITLSKPKEKSPKKVKSPLNSIEPLDIDDSKIED